MGEVPLPLEQLEETRRFISEIGEIKTLRPRHFRLSDMIATYAKGPLTTSILELGCSQGEFVDYLREQGYNAEGMDINKKGIEISNKPYLHHGDIVYLDDVFGKKEFDLIVVTGVFNIGTQIEYLFGTELLKEGSIRTVIRYSPEREKAAEKNIEMILKGAFEHLTPSGFLMTVDNIMPGDYTAFTPETAINIGYKIVHHAKQEAILQKPLLNK